VRLTAYILAADPAWIEPSVRSYYDIVEEIVVCYDTDRLGWTGAPIAVDECIDRVRAVDVDRKVRLLGGSYYRSGSDPMENDTNQRQHALAAAGERADWVVELDTDEVMPDARYFSTRLSEIPREYHACFWPMRVMFKQVSPTRFLEVSTRFRTLCWEYPGPVACRPGVRLTHARRTSSPAWTFGVSYSLWTLLNRTSVPANARIAAEKAVVHFSWARSDEEIRRKVSGWSHSRDFDAEAYVRDVWGRAETRWRSYRNFHPVQPDTWPALRPVELANLLASR
jgi:hypothetical protein